MNKIRRLFEKNILYLCLVVALVSTLGSLFFSELLHFPPCSLCWYQRILMYPLIPILTMGILHKDEHLPFYVLPLSILGSVVAFYQHLLQVGIIPENLAPCGIGVSCSEKTFAIFDVITLPFLSFVAFAFITISMVIFLRTSRKI